MLDSTRRALAQWNICTKDEGPTLQIDPGNEVLVGRLCAYRDMVLREAKPLSGYEAPELVAARLDTLVDLIVEALLASRGLPVYTWGLHRASTDLYHATGEAFGAACERIAQIPGVQSQ